jgi:hypothetical protein
MGSDRSHSQGSQRPSSRAVPVPAAALRLRHPARAGTDPAPHQLGGRQRVRAPHVHHHARPIFYGDAAVYRGKVIRKYVAEKTDAADGPCRTRRWPSRSSASTSATRSTVSVTRPCSCRRRPWAGRSCRSPMPAARSTCRSKCTAGLDGSKGTRGTQGRRSLQVLSCPRSGGAAIGFSSRRNCPRPPSARARSLVPWPVRHYSPLIPGGGLRRRRTARLM